MSSYPITRIETISEERVNPRKLGYLFEGCERDLTESRLSKGDILFSHINSLKHIGKTAIYEGIPERLFHGMNLLLLRPDQTKVNPRYLVYLLRALKARAFFKTIAKKAVNQASINQTQLGSVRIPLPLISEQQRIADILSAVDEKLELESKQKTILERAKSGLMGLLLTGKIRVKVD